MISSKNDHKYSAFRRVGLFLMDLLSVLCTFIALLYTIGTILISNFAKSDIEVLNQKFEAVCITKDIPYLENELYGLSQLDVDNILKEGLDKGYTTEDGYKYYDEVNLEVNKVLIEDEAYKEAYTGFYTVYLITMIIMMLISLAILQLIIPLFTKKHQTFAMFLFGACLVNPDNSILTKMQVFLRFFFMFMVEYLIVFLGFNLPGLVMVLLVNIILMIATKSRGSIHDIMLKVRMTAQFNAKLE